MSSARTFFGAFSGLVLAMVLVAGVTLGAGSSHLDLGATTARSITMAAQGGQATGTAAPPQASGVTTQSVSSSSARSPISSLGGLAGLGYGSLGLLLLPILIGGVLATVFYAAFLRRVDAE